MRPLILAMLLLAAVLTFHHQSNQQEQLRQQVYRMQVDLESDALLRDIGARR